MEPFLYKEGKVIGGFVTNLWKLGLRATVPAVLQCPRVLFMSRVVAVARVGGAQGTPAAGLRLRLAREKGFSF
jgi:hypothetical protein